jgi:hypothetical protein
LSPVNLPRFPVLSVVPEDIDGIPNVDSEDIDGIPNVDCALKDASIPTAKSMHEVMHSKYKADYMSGCYNSLVGHLENMTFLPVLRSSLNPGTKVYENSWATRYKLDTSLPKAQQVTRIDAHVALRGDQQVAGSYEAGQLYAGNTNPSVTRLLMKILFDFPEAKSNVSEARQDFSHSPAREVFYMKFPKFFHCLEYPEDKYVFVLRTVLEGTKQGGSAWDTYSCPMTRATIRINRTHASLVPNSSIFAPGARRIAISSTQGKHKAAMATASTPMDALKVVDHVCEKCGGFEVHPSLARTNVPHLYAKFIAACVNDAGRILASAGPHYASLCRGLSLKGQTLTAGGARRRSLRGQSLKSSGTERHRSVPLQTTNPFHRPPLLPMTCIGIGQLRNRFPRILLPVYVSSC